MNLFLHAIAERGLPDPPRGLRGQPLEFIPATRLGVWASPVGERADTREDAFDHHRVVEELCARQACLPIRFGTRAAGASAAQALVAGREAQLAAAIGRIGRRRELAVTLLWQDSGVRPGRGHALPAAGSGRSFLERKRAAYAAAGERRAAAEALATRLVAGLAADQSDVRHAYCPSTEVALSTAILAPEGGEHALKEKAVRVAAELAGVRAVVSGPWPPYTFADGA